MPIRMRVRMGMGMGMGMEMGTEEWDGNLSTGSCIASDSASLILPLPLMLPLPSGLAVTNVVAFLVIVMAVGIIRIHMIN